MSQDRSSWLVKDEAVLQELIDLLELSAAEQQLLGALGEVATATAPEMVEAFYARLFQHEATAEYLRGSSMERLHSMVANWFSEIFCGCYDEDYARRRLNIGHIHARIGLPVRYPLVMLDLVLPFGQVVVNHSAHPDAAATAFRKVLALDVAIFNQAYEDHQLRHLAELVGGERLARRLLTQGA